MIEQSKSELQDIDAFVRQEMETWKVPGVALAIVKNGVVLFAAGYGWRDRERGLPVTTETPFPIASITKSFTVAVLGILAEQGRLEWDRPIREYLPDLQLWDASLTNGITTRDLVSHRSGLPRHDWIWQDESLTREEIYRRLRYLEPNQELRQSFQYNNLMFLVAGYLAERITGATWEDTVQSLLLSPLAMKHARASVADWGNAEEHAIPYELDDNGAVQRGRLRNLDSVAPAGGISASIEDMARYLVLCMNKGQRENRQVIPESVLQEMQTPQIAVPETAPYPEIGPTHYGMGFYLSSYRGYPQVRHDGGLRGGFSSMLSFLPEQQIGVVVLSNLTPTSIPRIVACHVFDRFLNLEPIPWSERARQKTILEDHERQNRSNPVISPIRTLSDYIADYTHPGYGTVTIRQETPDAPLIINYHGYRTPLNGIAADVFETAPSKQNRLDRISVRFESEAAGNIIRVRIPLEPEIADIPFARV